MVVTDRDVNATLSPVELLSKRFDELCAEKDATTEVARAELAGVDRRTLYRWREGLVTPGFDAALALAKKLGTTVEDLWRLRRSPR